MKVKWEAEGEVAQLTLTPETALDRSIIEGIGIAQSASIKKNGVLTFIIDVPKVPISKPAINRPADEVRDNQ